MSKVKFLCPKNKEFINTDKCLNCIDKEICKTLEYEKYFERKNDKLKKE